jgi:hypothetical protein
MKKLSILLAIILMASSLMNNRWFVNPSGAVTSYAFALYVSPTGSDENDGSLERPYLSLEKARDFIRLVKKSIGLPAGGVMVWLRGGTYQRNETFTLTTEDSGTAESPIEYKAYHGETVRIMGGKKIDGGRISLTTSSSNIWNRLDAAAKGKVYQMDVSDMRLAGYGDLAEWSSKDTATAPISLYMNQKPMTIARWPDAGVIVPDFTPLDETITLLGATNAGVAGTYVKYAVVDGVNAYRRNGLINGKQYFLSRSTWNFEGTPYVAWFLKSDSKTGYPNSPDPWWYCYSREFTRMSPIAGATGDLIVHRQEAIDSGFAMTSRSTSGSTVAYSGNRPERWGLAEDGWMNGFWKNNDTSVHVKIGKIDKTSKTISALALPKDGTMMGQQFYAENLLEEITVPGEWYMNRSTGMIWFWPISAVASSEMALSTFEGDLIDVRDAGNIGFSGLVLEMSRAACVRVTRGNNIVFSNCIIRNSGSVGVVLNGSGCKVMDSEICNTGRTGVQTSGGVRSSLTPGANVISNNRIHDVAQWQWTGEPAITVEGVGHSIKGNTVWNAPGFGIMLAGNNHLVEKNEVYGVCRFSEGSGAIGLSSDWGFRGNIFRYNYIHDITSFAFGDDVNGICLNDCASGNNVFSNIIRDVAGAAMKNGGGRDNRYENNVIVNSGTAFAVDSRGLRRINNIAGDFWNLLERLADDGIKYQSEPWAKAYPTLAAVPNDWVIVGNKANGWLYPQGTFITGNIGYNNGKWIAEDSKGGVGTIQSLLKFGGNIENMDPMFVDKNNGSYTLKPASPAFKIKGFVKIPFSEIGARTVK